MMDADQRKIIDELKEHHASYPAGMQPTFFANKMREGIWAEELVRQALKEIQQEEQQRQVRANG